MVSPVTGGLTSYGVLTSYGWSHKLRVVSQVTGGLTSSHRKNLWRLVLDQVTTHRPKYAVCHFR